MRTYGVEMECYVPASIGQDGVADALRALGLNASASGYGGRNYDRWQIKTDCSLDRRPHGYVGIEVVSPVLRWGHDGDAAALRLVSEYLVSIDAKVNRSCGGHVHVYVGDLTGEQLANLIGNYAENQYVIDDWIAPSRQARVERDCDHCGGMHNGTHYARQIHNADTAARHARLDDYGYMSSYLGGHVSNINGDWFTERGTFEFRQRQGSVNHYRINGWVSFLMGLIGMSMESAESFNSSEDMLATMVEAEYLSALAAEWLRGNVPTVDVPAAITEARAAARRAVNRLLSVQGL